MASYDAVLKTLLQAAPEVVLSRLSKATVTRWLNVEIPKFQLPRVDLLGETTDGGLVHLELQSTSDTDMALRMAEYALAVYREFDRFPVQAVLYVGEPAMRMSESLTSADFSFRYRLLDFREIDGESLLASDRLEHNLLSILARLRDGRAAVKRILQRLESLDETARLRAFEQFLLISGLRRLGATIREEAQKMPILNDILDHDLLGPAIRQGLEQGLEQGREEGRASERLEVARKFIAKRFGPLPESYREHLAVLSPAELSDLLDRVLETPTLAELFKRPR